MSLPGKKNLKIIFVFLVYSKGETYFSRDQVIEHGIVAHDIGEQIGLQDGDKRGGVTEYQWNALRIIKRRGGG